MSLRFFINDGQVLKSADMFGKMENYVRIRPEHGGHSQEYRSQIVQGSAKSKKADNRITWNEEVRIELPRTIQDACLHVSIMDEGMGKD